MSYYNYPPPSYGPPPPPSRRPGPGTVAVIAVLATLGIVGGIVGGVALTRDDGDTTPTSAAATTTDEPSGTDGDYGDTVPTQPAPSPDPEPVRNEDRYIAYVHSHAPPESTFGVSRRLLIKVGDSTCGVLDKVDRISGGPFGWVFGRLTRSQDDVDLPQQTKDAYLAGAALHLCPAYADAYRRWAGHSSSSST